MILKESRYLSSSRTYSRTIFIDIFLEYLCQYIVKDTTELNIIDEKRMLEYKLDK